MAKNKIEYGNETLIDLTGDTVVEDALVVGYTAHGADGELVAGGNPYKKAETDTTVQTQSDLIDQIKTALEGKAAGGGVQLPTLSNPGTANDLALGKEMIDADGNVVTGNVNIRDSGTWVWPDGSAAAYPDNATWADYVIALHTIQSGTVMYRAPATVAIPIPYSDFGDAQPSDVAAGKIFTSAAGLRAVGTGGGGLVVKTGTTTSSTINTGLKDVEQFIIYKESQTAAGLIHLHYSKSGGTSRMYASAWSTQNYGTKTITNGTGGVSVNGGTVTISATQAAQGALTSGVTYKWIAIGAA